MNTAEATKLLAFATAFEPNLAVTREVAAVWAEVLDDIVLVDATAALRTHYRESRYPIRPADIVQGVEAIHKQRVRDAGELPPEPPDDLAPGTHHLWLKAYWRAVKAGEGRERSKAIADIEGAKTGGERRELGPATEHVISELVQR